MSTHQLLFLNAETPVHLGAGTGLGYIDNPIQREVPNEYPKAEATGIKGVIRQYLERNVNKEETDRKKVKEEVVDRYLGKSDQKGSLQPSDGYLLLFPVITPRGTVAYLTCPFVLARLSRQLNQHDHPLPEWANLTVPTIETVLIPKDSALLNDQTKRVVLQHRAFEAIQNLETDRLATWIAERVYPTKPGDDTFWSDWLRTRIAIVHDDVFRFFVKAHTEVRTGNKIDPKTGIVQTGLLFTTEYLPEGSVLYCWLEADPEFVVEKGFTAQEGLKFFTDNLDRDSVLQIGGKTSVGKGQIRLTYTSTDTKK